MQLTSTNIKAWVEQNRDLLKPPVGNKVLFQERECLVMVVGGPNARTDFHYNETPEFFYQLEGTIFLDLQVDGRLETITIGAGEMYMLPARVPHRPRRGENTVGLVVELARNDNAKDGLIWHCKACNNKLYEEYFVLTNIETDFQPVFKRFKESPELRTCSACGLLND